MNRLPIFGRQRLAFTLLLGAPAGMRALIEARDERRIGTDFLDALLDRGVKARDQRRHEHDHAHAEHHTEHRQKLRSLCARSVSIACFKFSPYACAMRVPQFSARSASIGSSRAARVAG